MRFSIHLLAILLLAIFELFGTQPSAQALDFSEQGTTCAAVYQYKLFDGEILKITQGQNISNLDRWENRISSVLLGANCTITLYQFKNYEGKAVTYTGSNSSALTEIAELASFNNLASSLTCQCSNDLFIK